MKVILELDSVRDNMQSLARYLTDRSGRGTADRETLSRIERKVDILMSQQDDLMEALNQISVDVDTELARIDQLTQQLTTINDSTPPEVDLQPAIDLANSIRAKLEAVGTSASTNVADAAGGSSSGDSSSATDTSTGDTTNSSVGGSTADGDSGATQGSSSDDLSGGAVGTPTDSTVTPTDDQSNPA